MSVGKNLFVLKHCTFFQIICHSVTELLVSNYFVYFIIDFNESDEAIVFRITKECLIDLKFRYQINFSPNKDKSKSLMV